MIPKEFFRMRSFIRWALVPGIILGALGLSACGPASAASPTAVKLALDWIPNTNHTGIYVALQQGYYRQHGLNVTLVPYGSTAPEALVASGQVQFAVSFEESVAILRAQGQPLVSVAAIIQHDTSAMAVLASSNITRPAQFAGKHFASSGDPAEQAVIDAMERNDGVAHPSYTQGQPQDASFDVLGHGYDFVWIYAGVEGVQAQDAGTPLRLFYLNDYGIPDFYSPVLITSAQEIAQHPDVVRAFVAATAQGYSYAVQNPKASADMLLQGAKAQGGTLFASNQVAYDSQTYQSQHYTADAKCWGQQSLATWTGFSRFLYQNGALLDANNKPLTSEPDYSAMFTNAYLPAC
jgi:ABC-type nitrate/sulfonate/bicarbonate transport system substrate-binding protein